VAQGAGSNYTNLLAEPGDHGLGRSRGGLSTKIHQLVDGHGRPLVVLVGPGQAGDAPMFPHLMMHLSIARPGPGRPRTRPERVRADNLGDPTLADAICDRIVHTAHRIELRGESLRRPPPDQPTPTPQRSP
jgi:transposase